MAVGGATVAEGSGRGVLVGSTGVEDGVAEGIKEGVAEGVTADVEVAVALAVSVAVGWAVGDSVAFGSVVAVASGVGSAAPAYSIESLLLTVADASRISASTKCLPGIALMCHSIWFWKGIQSLHWPPSLRKRISFHSP